jgi:hypothetical protein
VANLFSSVLFLWIILVNSSLDSSNESLNNLYNTSTQNPGGDKLVEVLYKLLRDSFDESKLEFTKIIQRNKTEENKFATDENLEDSDEEVGDDEDFLENEDQEED